MYMKKEIPTPEELKEKIIKNIEDMGVNELIVLNNIVSTFGAYVDVVIKTIWKQK